MQRFVPQSQLNWTICSLYQPLQHATCCNKIW